MKKVLAFVLAVLMVLPMVACSGAGFSRGDVDGNVYKNDSVGITFTAPENWEFMSEEEISVEWNLGNKSFDEQLKSGEAFDAVAKCTAPGAGNLATFKLVDLNKKYGEALSIEDYIEELRDEFEQKNPKSQVRVSDLESVEFGGEAFTRVVIGTMEDKTSVRYITYLKEMENEGYLFSATVMLLDETEFDDVEAMFK